MAGELAVLDTTLDELWAKLEAGERKQLAMRIAADLRKANAGRITANEDPDGAPFVPRKKLRSRAQRDKVTGLKRKVKAQKMFLRSTGANYLRKVATTGEARVGFVGAMARIMAVHQRGLRDTVTRDPNSPSVKYAERRVLGMNAADRLHILETAAAHLKF